MAILTAVYATPKSSTLIIHTDSQASIDSINNSLDVNAKIHKKLKNWTLLYAIKELIVVQDIHLQLVKVKAHSGIEHNKLADKLAKDGIFQSKCIPNIPSLSSVNAIGQWRSKIIEVPLRGFVKKIGTSRHTAQWRLLNRHLDVMSDYKSQQVA
ncbi:hypothetical protein Glove_365g20 [Diversispora epigaea]|uniref:RNase H type-1 domain-containing protein n=1 Tax=Diversispora epigaea TaxID=1348612 RepID=A0A397HC57_9GLOM|nr:hypothetical protein Glove_365g20 [Diversispora epigaea]